MSSPPQHLLAWGSLPRNAPITPKSRAGCSVFRQSQPIFRLLKGGFRAAEGPICLKIHPLSERFRMFTVATRRTHFGENLVVSGPNFIAPTLKKSSTI
jgi:hypothetical protein